MGDPKDRIVVIGDVHGCVEELSALLDLLQPQKGGLFVFLGDLVNRGPDSIGTLRLARSLPNVKAIMGNHEYRLLRYRRTRETNHLKKDDRDVIPHIKEKDWEFIANMYPYIYLENLDTVLVHGGFLPNIPWRKQSMSITSHIQVIDEKGLPARRTSCPNGTPWWDMWKGPPYVIYGHTPNPEITKREWSLGIDTGCAMGGCLTACILPEKQIIQVPAKKKYC